MYYISYDYTTGNSFGSKRYNGQKLPYRFEKESTIIENVKRLEDHYNFYRRYHNYRTTEKTRDQLEKELKSKSWFVPKDVGVNVWEFSVKLVNDDGKEFKVSPPWIGYFETLHRLEIVNDEYSVDFDEQ